MNIIKQARNLKKGDIFTLQNSKVKFKALDNGCDVSYYIRIKVIDRKICQMKLNINRPVIIHESSHDSPLTNHSDQGEL